MRNSPRCVFDTNVLISALLFNKSKPAEAFFTALHSGEILVSADAISELNEVLGREKFDKYLTKEERELFLRSLLQNITLVEINDKVRACRDPKEWDSGLHSQRRRRSTRTAPLQKRANTYARGVSKHHAE